MKKLLRDLLDFPDPILAVLLAAGAMLVFWILTR